MALNPTYPRFPYTRRQFFRVGGELAIGAYLAAGPGQASGSERSAPARSCILVYLLGGPPHLDTFDLKPDAPAEIRGPFRPIATTLPGVKICEHLPRLAQLAHRHAVVRSVTHNNHNHTPMIFYTLTGRQVEQPNQDNDIRPPQRTDPPHLGALLARFKPAPRGLPGYVAIPELGIRSSLQGEYKRARTPLRGGHGGFLGPLFDPLAVDGEPGTAASIPALLPPLEVPGDRLERRAALMSVLDGTRLSGTDVHRELRRQAVVLTGTAAGRGHAFSLEGETPRRRDRYGQHRFGKAMLLAGRLAEAGVPMIAVHFNEMTICDGWDTHSKNFQALESELLPMLDQSLSALIEDLDQRGLLEQTLILVMGNSAARRASIRTRAGTTGACASRFSLPAAASRVARSSALPTALAPTLRPNPSTQSISMPRCSIAWASIRTRSSTIHWGDRIRLGWEGSFRD